MLFRSDGRWIAATLEAPDPSLSEFCAARDSADVLRTLRARGIAVARCNDGADLLRDPVLAGVTLARDESGTLVKGLPYRLNGAGIAIERAAPALGQHTDEVLRTLLGFDDARLRELADAGVTSTVPTVGDV